jgi:hypothetical protein
VLVIDAHLVSVSAPRLVGRIARFSGRPGAPNDMRVIRAASQGHDGGMGIIFHKTIRLGPVRLHFTKKGFSSWSLHFWRWTWNSKTRKSHVDLPGPVSWSNE